MIQIIERVRNNPLYDALDGSVEQDIEHAICDDVKPWPVIDIVVSQLGDLGAYLMQSSRIRT